MKTYFAPSLMCMDLLNIKEETEILNQRADFYHVDIMDGHFVKNITLSPYFVRTISKIAKLPIDCHLMVTNPYDYIDRVADAGAFYITPHAETINAEAFRVINKIKSRGCKVGIAINPATPIQYIEQYIHHIDKLTIMSVDPGFSGQPYIPEMLKKISIAKEMKRSNDYKYLIEVDGSCNEKTYKELHKAGVEVFVMGSTGLFNMDKNLVKAWDIMIQKFNEQIAHDMTI